MSTNATVSILNEDKSVETIYCHWDGYVEGLGADLMKKFKTEESVRGLLEKGDMSYIGEHYADRGESRLDVSSRKHQGLTEKVMRSDYQDYNYFFDVTENAWFLSQYNSNKLRKL